MLTGGRVNAPDFLGGKGWLNTDHPISLKDLRGKVVLLDFWTFCCINCMHIIPDLHKLEAKYPDELVVVGVHSAKFENEKDNANIREAILRYNIEHPVVNDADFKIWNQYAVRAWPTLVLIDPDGKIIGTAAGEGQFDAIDKAIAETVKKFSAEGKLDRKRIHFLLEKQKTANLASLQFPGKIISDEKSGTLYISDSGHNRIVIAGKDGHVKDIIGSGASGNADGAAASASFNHPQGLALDGPDKLYVADTENHLIRLVDLRRKVVSTIAGTGKQAPFMAKGGNARSSPLNSPWDLLLMGKNLYIAMAGAHQIWLYDTSTNNVTPFAGNGGENILDGPIAFACFAQPSGITSDGSNLYVADSEVSAIRKIDLNAKQVSTIIGKGLFDFGDIDGNADTARLQHPLGILWRNGKLYVADSYNHKIKVVDPNTRTAKSLIGTGKSGNALGAGGQLAEPAGLCAIDDELYIADTNNNRIAELDLASNASLRGFDITGLAPPSVPGLYTNGEKTSPSATQANSATGKDQSFEMDGPNPEKISLPQSKLSANASGKIHINLLLPKGYHLSEDAPGQYKVQQRGNALAFEPDVVTGKMPHALTFDIPFKSRNAGVSELSISLPVYYCTDAAGSLCLIKTFYVYVPVVIESKAPNTTVPVNIKVLP